MASSRKRLGRYEILAPLGSGGMGEVYRARDPELGREVAIKVLREDVARDRERLGRFRSEARAIGRLNHPNVIAVYDVGTEAGRPYLVTELLEGKTLRHRLAEDVLPSAAVLRVAVQIVRGLAAAHDHGIVHRDLKPENVFLCHGEVVKILDFGLARLSQGESENASAAPTQTLPGVVLGTARYMSPEQIRGAPVDERSDVFAFGTVLYEITSRTAPFDGDSPAEIMAAILHREPPALPRGGDRLATGLGRIALRCLEKDPGSRFQSARDVLYALEAITGDAGEPAIPAAEVSTADAAGCPSLAVLLFRDLSGGEGNEHLCVGLTDAIITELAELEDLIVRPTSAVLRYSGRRLSPREAGSELRVDTVLDGSFHRAGNRLRITVQLVSVSEARPLWAAKIDSSLDDVFGMQDKVSREVAAALALRLATTRSDPAAEGAGVPARAYERFLEGKFHLHREGHADVRAAVEALEHACEEAPGFARAWVGLGEARLRMAWTFDPEGGWYERAEDACGRALALDDGLPEALYLRGRMLWSPGHGFDHAAGIRHIYRAATARPGFHDAHHYLAHIFFHVGMLGEASAALERALELDPEDLVVLGSLAFNRFLEGRYREGLEIAEALSQRSPTAWNSYSEAICYLRLGELREARNAASRISRHFPESVWIDSLEGVIAALEGDRRGALAAVDRIAANEKAFGHFHHAQHDAAVILAQVGDATPATEWLTAAADNGFPCASAFAADPLLDPLRGDDAFETLMRRLREECERYRLLYAELRSQDHRVH